MRSAKAPEVQQCCKGPLIKAINIRAKICAGKFCFFGDPVITLRNAAVCQPLCDKNAAAGGMWILSENLIRSLKPVPILVAGDIMVDEVHSRRRRTDFT